MKPKQKKQKKPLNKWKITAIISLVVNGLVAILLAIGLTQPKTQKTSALGTGGNYTLYMNSENVNPLSFNLSYFQDLSGVRIDYFSSDNFYAVYFENGSTIAESYLPIQNNFARAIYCYLTPHGVSYLDYYLSDIYLYPFGASEYRRVFHSDITISEGTLVYSNIYAPLSPVEPYSIFIDNSNPNYNQFFNYVFTPLGTNEVIEDFEISENWKPNKYISLVTDSIGLLYDSPSTISGATIDGISGVKWSQPIYRGDNTSQLGFLEIPLLFTSHGENFIGIRLYYDVVMNYVDKNNEIQTFSYGSLVETSDYHFTFVYMSYVYELATSIGSANYYWKEKVVCALPVYRTLTTYIQDNIWVRNFIYEVYQPYNWLHEDYKSIGVYDASTPFLNRVGFSQPMNTRTLAINNMTIREILEFDMTQNDYGINTNGYVNIGNVFVLISSAFSSVLPLLSVVIVPGITIGMLLFIPLILTIIIVVIKLVKR